MRHPLIPLLAAALLTVAMAMPASAIVYGQRDTENTYSNVGALLIEDEGELFRICSGTLIDDQLFLTAAHCVLGWDGDFFVSFAPNWLEDEDPIRGDATPHPSAFCCGSNDWFDIAVVELDASPVGVSPAPLPSLDLLGQMSRHELQATTFTAVGYGAVRDTRRQAFQSLLPAEGWRSYAHQSALSLTKAWFTLSMNEATGDGGTCYGDSGGPHFLPGGTVVSITVTGDVFCKATDKTYRIDTATSLEFIAGFLD